MGSGRGVLFMNGSESRSVEVRRHPHQRRPHSAMYQSDLAVHQAAGKNVGRIANVVEQLVHQMTLRMAPPAAVNLLARDSFGQIRKRATRGFHHSAMTLDELHRLL